MQFQASRSVNAREEAWMQEQWLRIRRNQLPKSNEVKLLIPVQHFSVILNGLDNSIGITEREQMFLGPRLAGLENEPWFHFAIAHEPNHWFLLLNGEIVLEIRHNTITHKRESFSLPHSRTEKLSIQQKDISSWITKRQSIFRKQQSTSVSYTLVPLQEQERQLNEVIVDLEKFISEFQSGDRSRLKYISAILRSLLCFKVGSTTLDPLLLRLASFKLCSLPVYVSPFSGKSLDNCVLGGMSYPEFHGLSCAVISPDLPCIVLVDFQEYLETPTLFYKGNPITPLALIEKTANTEGLAHFDQRVPIDIQALKNIPITFTETFLEHYLLKVAVLTCELSKLVVIHRYSSSMK